MTYPTQVLPPGSHGARFWTDERSLPGTVHLEAGKFPRCEFFDEDLEHVGGGFPKDTHKARLVGQLRSNQDITLHDVRLSEFFPGRFEAYAQYALVGLGITEYEGALTKMAFQIEDLDVFFMGMPVKAYQWPHGEGGHFRVDINAPDEVSWSSPGGATLSSAYPWQVGPMDGYGFRVSFAPTVEVEHPSPLSVTQWVEEWLRPFTRLVSFAIGSKSMPTWVVFSTPPQDELGNTRQAQLYASGITQSIYTAVRPLTKPNDRRPLFTRQDLPSTFPDLITQWRELDLSDNPFPELFRLATAPDLPLRAKFLYLVQALEGAHGYEQRSDDERRQREYEIEREEIIRVAKEKLGSQMAKRLKGRLPKRAIDSLDRRIKGILDATPQTVRQRLTRDLQADPLAMHYQASRNITLHETVRLIRNDLSHGNYNPPHTDLLTWVNKLELLSQAHMLRLLGFDDDFIASKLS